MAPQLNKNSRRGYASELKWRNNKINTMVRNEEWFLKYTALSKNLWLNSAHIVVWTAKVEYMSTAEWSNRRKLAFKKIAYETNSGPKQPWLDAAGRGENDTFLVTALSLWYA